MSSIFTRIIRGEIPCYKIAESEDHFSFLDINPISEGHTLVVPKSETDYFFDLSDSQLHELMTFSRYVARGIDMSLKPLRTGVIVQGLEVPHAHVHLIPLYSHTQSMALGNTINVSESRMNELAKKISGELG